MPKSPSFITALVLPPGANHRLTLPTRTIPYPTTNPPPFNDALAVRLEVFVDEQKCTAALEIDDDDPRSWQWVIYDENYRESETDGGAPPRKVAVAVIRLVPPPHAPHEVFAVEGGGQGQASGGGGGEDTGTGKETGKYDLEHEPFIKFGRVAVLPEYRGFGLGRRLMEVAMGWAGENVEEINAALGRVVREERREGEQDGRVLEWKGLALVHAQSQVERMYERLGFVTDEELGRWVEEGIDHLGMWKRLDVKS